MAAPATGLEALVAQDADIARAFAVAGRPPNRHRKPGFATLLGIIVNQQVSQHAGRAIWGRIEDGLGRVAPETVLAAADGRLAGFGLSRAKVRYAKALAAAVAAGEPDLDGLAALDDETARARLVEVPGIGRWTADIYLMFALGRPDIWPAGDLALAVATGRLLGLAERPRPKALETIGQRWRPWRSAAAAMLWHFYRHAAAAAAER